MQIRLDLSRHCIETASRLKVEALIRSYFKHPLPETELAIRSLTGFLEQADFPALRQVMARLKQPDPATAILVFPRDPSRMEIRFGKDRLQPLSDTEPHNRPGD